MQDIFESTYMERGGGIFGGKFQSGYKDPIFVTLVAFTHHARHAKSQSATSFG